MLPRTYINPPGHWVTDPPLPYSQAVRCGEMLFTTGQMALDNTLKVIASGDLNGQIDAAINDLIGVLDAAGMSPSDLVQMRAFYVDEPAATFESVANQIAKALGPLAGPGPALTVAPVQAMMSPGPLFEIEAIAMHGQNGETLPRTTAWDPNWAGPPAPFSHAIRVGEMCFTSGVTAQSHNAIEAPGDLTGQSHAVLRRINGLLRQLGADINDTVKTNLFNVEAGIAQDWAAPALARASYYREPGPAATGLSLKSLRPEGLMIINDVVAMRGHDGARLKRTHVWPDNHWDWTVHLPYRHGIRCGDLIFLGGQVPLNPDASVAHKGDLKAQTDMAMEYIRRVLAEMNLDFGHVLRINTFYATGDEPDAEERIWKENLHARFAHFEPPGPATTGIPMPYLAYEDMNIEIDIIAMV